MRLYSIATLFQIVSSSRLSPYPAPACGLNGASVLYVVDDSQLSNDDILTVSSIQGRTAIQCPSVYRTQGPGSSYSDFLSYLQQKVPRLSTANATVDGLVTKYKTLFADGYAVVNLTDGSTSAGFTLAALRNVALFTAANENLATAAGLTLLEDLTGATVDYVLDKYNTSGSALSTRIAALQDPSKYCCLGDYTIFAGAVNFWSTDMGSPLTTRVLSSLQPGPAAVFGWGVDESSTVAAASAYGAYVHASDWARNLATLTGIGVPNARVQPNPRLPVPPTAASGASASPAVHTVTFLMTDGDNVQWLLNGFAQNPLWWGSPDRGSVELGWTLTPALVDLAPIVLEYLLETSTPRDYFV